MSDQDFREKVAALCHEQWAHWMRYLFSVSIGGDGKITTSVVIPPKLVYRWRRQSTTPYSDLSEQEKDSDREWADRYIELFSECDDGVISQEEVEKVMSDILDELISSEEEQ